MTGITFNPYLRANAKSRSSCASEEKHERYIFRIDESVPQQQWLSAKKDKDSPGCPCVKPASGQPVQAQARQLERNEIREMPEIRRKQIWKDTLNDFYQDGRNRYESRAMTIKG